MSRSISYANIAINFKTDTSGIKNASREVASLTRLAKSQMSDLDKYIHQLGVISELEKKEAYSAESIAQMKRVVSRAFIDASSKSGKYLESLQSVAAFVPELASEVNALSFAHQRDAEASEMAAKKEARRAEILDWLNRKKREEIRLIQERDAMIAKAHVQGILADQDSEAKKRAEEEAYIARTNAKREKQLAAMHVEETLQKQKKAEQDLEDQAKQAKKTREEEIRLIQERDAKIAASYKAEVLAEQDRQAKLEATIAAERRHLEALQAKAHVEEVLAAKAKRRAEVEQMVARIAAAPRLQAERMLGYEEQALRLADRDLINKQNALMYTNRTVAEMQQLALQTQKTANMSKEQGAQYLKQLKTISQIREQSRQIEASQRASVASGIGRDVMSGLSFGGVPGAGLLSAGLTAGGIAGATIGVKESLDSYAELRKELVRLEVIYGDVELAQKKFNQMRAMGVESGLGRDAVARSAATLAQFGIETQNSTKYVAQLMDVASGSPERFQSLALAFGQVKAANRLMGQEMLQFVNAGWSPLQTIAQKTGIEFAKLKKMMEEGKVSFQDVSDALAVETQKGGKFEGFSEKFGTEYPAAVNRFSDSWNRLKESFGEALAPNATAFMNEMAGHASVLSDNLTYMTGGLRIGVGKLTGDQQMISHGIRNISSTFAQAKEEIKPIENPFKNIKGQISKEQLEAARALAEARGKEAEKIAQSRKELDGVKKLQEQIDELKMGKEASDLKRYTKEVEDFWASVASEQKVRSGIVISTAETVAKEIAQYKALQAELKILNEQEDRRKKLKEEAASIIDKNLTQAEKMDKLTKELAEMVQGGFLTQQQAAKQLQSEMKDKETKYDLPKILRSGSQEAYKAIYSRQAEMDAKRLEEQRKQRELQEAANRILKQISENTKAATMGLTD